MTTKSGLDNSLVSKKNLQISLYLCLR